MANSNHTCKNCPVLDLLCRKKCNEQQKLSEDEMSEVNAFIQTDMNEIPNRQSKCSNISVCGSAIEFMTDDKAKAALADYSMQVSSNNNETDSATNGALRDSYIFGKCESMLTKILGSFREKNEENDAVLCIIIEQVFDLLIGYLGYADDQEEFKERITETIPHWKQYDSKLEKKLELL